MIAIRIPKNKRGKAWRTMIEIGPISLISKAPIYEVLPAHLEALRAKGIPFEVVPLPMGQPEDKKNATAD